MTTWAVHGAAGSSSATDVPLKSFSTPRNCCIWSAPMRWGHFSSNAQTLARATRPTAHRARCGAQSPPVYPPGQSCALRTRIIPGRRQAPTSTAWSCERGPRDHSDVTRLNRAVGRPRDGPDAGPQIRPRPTRDPPPNSQPHRPLGCPAARMCPQTRRPEYHIKPEAAL